MRGGNRLRYVCDRRDESLRATLHRIRAGVTGRFDQGSGADEWSGVEDLDDDVHPTSEAPAVLFLPASKELDRTDGRGCT